MKKSSLLFLCFVSLSGAEWMSYNEALKVQSTTGKTIMIDVVRTDCHYCIDMEKAVFDDVEMSKWLNKRFILAKVNLDHEKAPLGIKTSFTPSFFFIDKNQELIKKIPGSWNISDFKDLTKNILKDKK